MQHVRLMRRRLHRKIRRAIARHGYALIVSPTRAPGFDAAYTVGRSAQGRADVVITGDIGGLFLMKMLRQIMGQKTAREGKAEVPTWLRDGREIWGFALLPHRPRPYCPLPLIQRYGGPNPRVLVPVVVAANLSSRFNQLGIYERPPD